MRIRKSDIFAVIEKIREPGMFIFAFSDPVQKIADPSDLIWPAELQNLRIDHK
jgi:hypothetical protein